MTTLLALFWRDLRRAWGSGALWLPVLFFLLVATAFPFAVGPDAPLLRRAEFPPWRFLFATACICPASPECGVCCSPSGQTH